jgi:hypothetical protein
MISATQQSLDPGMNQTTRIATPAPDPAGLAALEAQVAAIWRR